MDEVVIKKIAEAKAEVARAEAQREAAERAEALRISKEKAEAERIGREKAEKEAREKAEADRIAREKIEREREEAERIAQEEAVRKAEAKRLAEEEKKAAKKKVENDKKDKTIKGVTFKDLGLPSKTLWASQPIRKTNTIEELSFREAKKLYHLPTFKQWVELSKECQIKGDNYGISILSAEGAELYFGYSGSEEVGDHENLFLMFWLDEDEDSDKKVLCVFLEYKEKYRKFVSSTRRVFVGEKLPVMVVKSKK